MIWEKLNQRSHDLAPTWKKRPRTIPKSEISVLGAFGFG